MKERMRSDSFADRTMAITAAFFTLLSAFVSLFLPKGTLQQSIQCFYEDLKYRWTQRIRLLLYGTTAPLPTKVAHLQDRIHVQPPAARQERLFVQCAGRIPNTPPTWIGRYRHTGQWFFCRVRSHDCNDTLTVVFEDGTMQIGCRPQELRLPNASLSRQIEQVLQRILQQQNNGNSRTAPTNNNNNILKQQSSSVADHFLAQFQPPTYKGMDVWEAAKKGETEVVLTLIDRGDATPNDVEMLESTSVAMQHGRTPLYWAVFGGHVELVRELLARGGVDADGTAYLAVTSREKADDNRDLMFDPDTGTYSDWVDYPTTTTSPQVQQQQQSQKEFTKSESLTLDQDDTALIRAMLVAAKEANQRRTKGGGARRHVSSSSSSFARDDDAIRQVLPQRLYASTERTDQQTSECVVCLQNKADAIAVPCGHVSCCLTCLAKVRKNRDGCPICRKGITTIVPLHKEAPSLHTTLQSGTS